MDFNSVYRNSSVLNNRKRSGICVFFFFLKFCELNCRCASYACTLFLCEWMTSATKSKRIREKWNFPWFYSSKSESFGLFDSIDFWCFSGCRIECYGQVVTHTYKTKTTTGTGIIFLCLNVRALHFCDCDGIHINVQQEEESLHVYFAQYDIQYVLCVVKWHRIHNIHVPSTLPIWSDGETCAS